MRGAAYRRRLRPLYDQDMATQGERRALYFLAAVALLGAGTRAWRGRHVAVDTTGLGRQIDAVDGLERVRPSEGRRVGTSTKKSAKAPADRPINRPRHQ